MGAALVIRTAQEISTELVSSGLTQYQLTLLVELLSAMSTRLSGGSRVESPDAQVERRREWDREYRRKRRLAARATSTPCPPDKVDAAHTLSSFLPSVIEEGKGTSEKERKKEKVSGSARGHRLTIESPLTDEFLKLAIDLGATEPQAREWWTEFTNYWSDIAGHRGVRAGWKGTWRNRVKAKLEWTPNAKTGRPSSSGGSALAAIRNIRAGFSATSQAISDDSGPHRTPLLGVSKR